MKQVLVCGIATLDIVNYVSDFPAEDQEVRAIAQRICKGGNAANMAEVLAQSANHVYFAGNIANEPDGMRITRALKQANVYTEFVNIIEQGKSPTSYISLNEKNGSRTIVHYRDLPEYGFEQFKNLPHTQFDWIHFEGRNIEHTLLMLQHLQQHAPGVMLSLEIEKVRNNIEALVPYVSHVLFSKAYAKAQGFKTAGEFLSEYHSRYNDKQLVCAWGEEGAMAIDTNGELFNSAAYPPENIVDTIGAGDTFNAGYIHAQLQQQTLQKSIQYACQLAGKKIGLHGYSNLIQD